MTDLELCDCGNCPLKGGVKVLGKGTSESETYDIVGVGIAPAREELRQGSPFVGWSGTLLRKTLEQLGITEFYLTNTLLCELKEDIKVSDRNLAISCCKKRLLEEVKSRKPKLTIALGNIPLETLTGIDYKIRSVNGRILSGLVGPVLPVLHPASLARRPEEFYDFKDGLVSSIKFLNGTYQQATAPRTVVVTNENMSEVCQLMESAELVAVDLETTGRGFYPYGRDPDKIRCIALSVDDRTAYIVPGVSSPYYEPHPNYTQDPRLKEALSKARCIFHNGSFDVGFLFQAGYDVKIYFDTFLAHYLLDEREYSHSLKELSRKYRGAPEYEEDIKDYLPNRHSSYDLVPDGKLYEYASWDVTNTYGLSEGAGFRKKMQSWKIYWDLLMPCANMFSEIRHKGFRIDIGYLLELDEVLGKELDKATDELEELVGYYLNPSSPQEVAELLYDRLGYKEIRRYGRSTSKKVLELLGGPVCKQIHECRELGKLKSTYVLGMANFVDSNFRIHPATKLHGAVTGRISTEAPSVMNITKKREGAIKRLYLPEEGHLIGELDAKAHELRCYCAISGDEHLREVILKSDRGEGPDPHTLVAREVTRIRGKEITRQQAKSGVFGRLYGRGKESFKFGYGLSEEDVTELLLRIDTLFPSIQAYNRKIKDEIHKTGYLTSYFGRRRRFGLLTDGNKHELYRQGANFLVQSMASDINLYCMLHLYNLRSQLGVYPMFPVHDSIVMDIEDESAIPGVIREWENHANELVEGKMEFRGKLSVGPTWGETVPWEDPKYPMVERRP